jgi:hypothetical protein
LFIISSPATRRPGLLSAIRVGLMDLRYAKPLGGPGSFQRERSCKPTIARGTDFDLFTGKVL